ncbi:acetate--CoA ligase family protein [Mangrovihabitans endophyticus]|uniref:CoA-binding protein n=1 Tax=Mangrovihabitans endophyticus TaxID=1751298 RepID=A0A8J3FLT5_9ACTN|nr:acetate--CoA ligase family protein [Mangrovihabitans endophyticus]GGK74685.1 CoA-binding protein [Mangrovihabitans endophyticus]
MGTTDELIRPDLTPGRDPDRERARLRLVTPQRLRSFFAPRSVALVGASDSSGWAGFIVESLRTAGLPGPMVPVHRRHRSAFGTPTIRRLTDLDRPVDLAFALVPTDAVESVLDDAATVGIRNVIVLAAGFGEGGEAGRRRERRLADIAIDHDLTVLGPNCLGFVNAHAHAAPFGLHIVPPVLPGPVGIVLQSGALASNVMGFTRARAIGTSLLSSMGNEVIITAADVVDYLLDDDATKVIALFLESIRDPHRFLALADKALTVGKPLVVLKVGRTAAGRATALAHTGAIAGDDAVVAAVLRQHGVIRVDSLEELLITAGLFGYGRPPSGSRMGVVTASGGACDIIADRCADEGIEIPDFAPSTVSRLSEALPAFAAVRNPLDITGFTLADAKAAASGVGDVALNAVVDDPGVDFVFNAVAVPVDPPPDPAPWHRRYAGIVATQNRTGKAIVHFTTTCTDISPYGRDLLAGYGLHALGGIEFGIRALGHALRWTSARSRAALRPAPERHAVPAAHAGLPSGPMSEAASRDLVAAHGVRVVPGELATTAAGAVAAADRLGYPVALKICAAALTHKSDHGGVALDLPDAAAVAAAFDRVEAAGRAHAAAVDGVLVTAMRGRGVELFAGVTVDPSFGPVVAVGLGGVLVEVLHDVSLRALPVPPDEVERMLGELRGAAVLRGARGTPPVDLAAVAQAVGALGEAALALGPRLQTIEVNPLWVNGSEVEALDVLVVTRGG